MSSLFGNASKEMFDSYERVRKGKVFLEKHDERDFLFEKMSSKTTPKSAKEN